MAVKQVVFIVNTDNDGAAEALGQCAQRGCLDGPVKSIEYIPDNRLPFEPSVSFEFSGAASNAEVLKAEGVAGRQTWHPDGAVLANEPIKVVIAGGGKGKSGSFKVTCG